MAGRGRPMVWLKRSRRTARHRFRTYQRYRSSGAVRPSLLPVVTEKQLESPAFAPTRSSDPRGFIALTTPRFHTARGIEAQSIIALWLISGTIGVSRKAAVRHLSAYFFRKRLALAIARECQGVRSEVVVALPLPKTSRAADLAAASAFSFAIRRYSAGEQSFCKIKRERRAIVSQDATIKSLIITASGKPCRRLRPFMTDAFW